MNSTPVQSDYGLIIVGGSSMLPVIVGTMSANRGLTCPITARRSASCWGRLAASIVIISLGEFKFGPDLAGGITLDL